MKYRLIQTVVNRKAAKFHYKVVDEQGAVISERFSNREYVACTINGLYYFGRPELVGKGEHGKHVKRLTEQGKALTPIAYK